MDALTVKKDRKKNSNFDRIQLSRENGEKIKGWIEQITTKLSGVRVTKNELVNWLITPMAPELKPVELSRMRKDFFDEVSYAQWILDEVKRRKKNGDQIHLETLIKGPARQTTDRRERCKGRKIKPETQSSKAADDSVSVSD